MSNEPWTRKLYRFFMENGIPTNADIDDLSASISTINASLDSINSSLATVNNNINSINTSITSINSSIATINASNLSGTYQPTISDSVNLGSISVSVAQYARTGNAVTVFGSFTADATLASLTSFQITLPIATTTTSASTLAGCAQSTAIADTASIAGSGAPNHKAIVQWIAVDIASNVWSYNFTYYIN